MIESTLETENVKVKWVNWINSGLEARFYLESDRHYKLGDYILLERDFYDIDYIVYSRNTGLPMIYHGIKKALFD